MTGNPEIHPYRPPLSLTVAFPSYQWEPEWVVGANVIRTGNRLGPPPAGRAGERRRPAMRGAMAPLAAGTTRASWPATEAKAPSTVCATGRSATALAGGWLWALMGPALSRPDGRRMELGTDAAGAGPRVVCGRDGAAHHQKNRHSGHRRPPSEDPRVGAAGARQSKLRGYPP